ncbi:MAG: acylphosphatase [Euryarchaeota archaeon]|nr:acylphosphatase [Euryarchaeota archaeon]
MKKRATIVISGDVQDVGFRGTVMRLAQKAGLVGYTENMPDGSVRVVCEGEEKAIKSFIKKLDICEGVIDVEAVKVEWSKPKGKFRYFEVKYSNLGAEMFQGFATAGRMLTDVNTNIKTMHTDLKDGFSDLKSETRTTHEKLGSIDNRLGDALSRYDKIGKKMDNVETNLAELTKQITRLVDHMVDDKK